MGQLIEREAELERIESSLRGVRSGSGSTLLIEGEPGIGKTVLIESARGIAERDGVNVLAARAASLERELAFGVVRQLFERPLRELDAGARAELFEGTARLAEAPLGITGPDRATVPPPAPAAHLHGLYWLVANLADRGPLLLAIDDLHWADEPSLRFLSYLGRRASEHRLLICAGSRPLAVESRQRTALAAHSDGWRETLRPRPLSDEGVGRLIHRTLSADPEEEFCVACARASGGNPFLLGAALQALSADGVTPSAAEAKRVDALRPEGLSRMLLVRLGRLGGAATGVAHAIAVLGADATLRRVTKLSGLEPEPAAAAIAGLRREGVLAPGERLELVHPLVANAVHADLGEPARGLAHLRAARLLAEEGAATASVARHLLAAEPSADPWVVATLREAAGAALGEGAPEPAVAHLERAMAEPPAEAERAPVLAELGGARARTGQLEQGAEAIAGALELTDDPRARAEIALMLGEVLFVARHYSRALAVRERARGELADDDDSEQALRLEIEIAFARHMVLEPDWIDPLEAAAERASTTGPVRSATQSVLAYAAAGSGRRPAEEVARLALSAAAESPAPGESFLTLPFSAAALALVDRPEQGIVLLNRAIEDARRSADAPRLSFCSSFRARMSLEAGRAQQAEADAWAALSAYEEGAGSFSFALGILLLTLVERGRIEEAAAVLAEHADAADRERELFPYADFLWARGRLRAAQSRPAEAVEDLTGCGAMLARTGFTSPVNASWRSEAALAYHALGEGERARRLAAEELELARRSESARAVGIALRAVGLIEGGERGIDTLRESVSVLDRPASVLERAHSLVALGAALRRANHRREAREPLREGIELARGGGALPLAERAHAELRASGARPRRLVLSGVESLTPSERRVAEMAAEGLSNREIAQALYVTRKTVEYHLSNVYRKLDAGSREELPEALAG